MQIGKVIASVTATIKHPAYKNKPVFMVQPLDEDLKAKGNPWVAVDYVSCQVGDIILFGGAPGVAKEVFKLPKAPIRSLIVAIIDIIEMNGKTVYRK